MAEGGTDTEHTRSGRTVNPPHKYAEFEKDSNGRRPSRDRLLSATQLSANRSRPGSRTASPEPYPNQESDTDIEELLEKCDTPPARKPKGQCVRPSKSRSQRKVDKLTRAATPPTPPSGSAPRAAPGSGATSPVTVTIKEIPSPRNLPCQINPQSTYCDEDNVTFDRSQTQSVSASDSPKLSPRCGQCKPNGEVLKCERCLEIACAKCQKMDTAHLLILKQYDVRWFCNKGKPKSLNAIHTDKEIEDRCAEYMTQITKRITRVEKKLEEKATKADLENSTQAINTQLQMLQQEIKKLTHPQAQTTGTHPTMTAPINQDLASVVKEEITEREQIMAKKLNLVIHRPRDARERTGPARCQANDSNMSKTRCNT